MSARRRLARWFFGAVLVLGIGCILYPIVTNIAYQLGAYSAVSSYDDAVARRSPEELAQLWAQAYAYNEELAASEVRDPFAVEEVTAPLDRYFEVLDPDGTGMMGYVEVPSIGLELPLYHGTGEEVLQKGAGHIATTALPIDGDSIHPVLTGHTGLPDKLLFTNLSFVKAGDVFRVKVLDRAFSYEVASVDVVEPDDAALLQPTAGEDKLTLLTCTPYGINSHRLFVTGVPTADDGEQGLRPVVLLPILAAGFLAALLVAGAAVTARRALKSRARG
ncbi:class C sortase [Eggerthella timonensis]|uniref:class C sortase n=1 Tax=Eggerthella timonensis TaxID=1871008 RepID=UPI000C76CFC8|nr:class C sortase [Eggerthella timonensis]